MDNCLIIELIGVPGCGKTTAVKEVIKDLESKGKRILFLNDFFDNRIKLVCGAILSFIRYNKATRGEREAWNLFTSDVKTSSFKRKKKIDIFERLQFLYCCQKIAQLKDKYDIIISDQWIFQHAVCMVYDQSIDDYLVKLKLLSQEVSNLFNQKYAVIRCDVNVQETVRRICKRQNSNSSIDRLKSKRHILEQLCTCLKNNFNFFCNSDLSIKCISIDFNENKIFCKEKLAEAISLIEKNK